MRVGKALGRGAGQSPHSRRPSHLAPFVGEFDEALNLQSIQMLPYGHRRDAEASRYLRRSLRPASLELEQDTLFRTRIILHGMRWYPSQNISQDIA